MYCTYEYNIAAYCLEQSIQDVTIPIVLYFPFLQEIGNTISKSRILPNSKSVYYSIRVLCVWQYSIYTRFIGILFLS